MYALGFKCNEFTFPSVLKACSITKDLNQGKQIHAIVISTGYDFDVLVANTLVVMYAICAELFDCRRLFYEIPELNVVSWNALFSIYVQNDCWEEAVNLFQEMISSGIKPDEFSLSSILNACTGSGDYEQGRRVHGYLIRYGYDSDPFSANALVDMYMKLGDLDAAMVVFEQIARPDIVSWNAVIAGCALHGYNDWALGLLREMKRSGILPNMFTLSSILKACAVIGIKDLGRQIHSDLIKMNIELDLFLKVGLIYMHSKCGHMENARMVFDSMPERDLISWNSVISGYAQNEGDKEVISLFFQMQKEELSFNQTTLSSVLKSIGSLQVVDMSKQIHALAVKSGLQFDIYVVNSLIDSYGKCSCLEDAKKVFKESPLVDVVTFTSVITAYAQYGEAEEALKLYLWMLDIGLKPDR